MNATRTRKLKDSKRCTSQLAELDYQVEGHLISLRFTVAATAL